MEAKPDLEHGIYRVRHTLVLPSGACMSCESDFISRDGQLLLVLDWSGDQPAVTLPLDETLLKPDARGEGYYEYSGQLVDPRTMQ